MHPDTNRINISYAPTDRADLYPETDGEPMAASDYHLEILIWLLQILKAYFAEMPDTYISGDILTYYTPRAIHVMFLRRMSWSLSASGKSVDTLTKYGKKGKFQTSLWSSQARPPIRVI